MTQIRKPCSHTTFPAGEPEQLVLPRTEMWLVLSGDRMLGVTAGTLLAFLGGYCSHLQAAPWYGLEMFWIQMCVCVCV